jgi:hypothetical protein
MTGRVPSKRDGGIPLLILPSVVRSQQVVDEYRAGKSIREIAVRLVGSEDLITREFVTRVVGDIDNYDTHLDEVAVQRAYEGDRDAWVALTHWERKECVHRIISRAALDKTHVRWPALPVHRDYDVSGWLWEWATAVGESPRRFQRLLVHRNNKGTAV